MKLTHLVVMAMLPVMLIGCGSAEDKVVINYCKALEAGKFDEAESYLSTDAKQLLYHAGGKPLMVAAAGKFKQHNGLSAIKITKKKVKGNNALVEFIYNFKDGSKYGDSFPLVKENGKWKISQ